ncbi:SusC/RagA family TonB-linked outer membrane protein [Chitinophaga pendula]|uniref:SusC/RagA family TonB-linked outer membrane protein n=1 Tax=Chitinophaga pendula TaxID=2849666 RepID=UPI001CEC95B8|nr:SusC/RagA family TonB-linked outer membrane protein [Chitinophaga pendula]UCJ08521.1 SusC/RagA family TonB-linked outer membrane protein [Chitinophaga pendula]
MNKCTLLLAGVLSVLCPDNTAPAAAPLSAPARVVHTQPRSIPLPVLLKTIQQRHKVSFIYEESLLKGKACTCDAARTRREEVEQYVAAIIAPMHLKLKRFNDYTYAIISADTPDDTALPAEPIPSSGRSHQLDKVSNTAQAGTYHVSSADALQQRVVISGRIVAEENEDPLPGAIVMVEGTNFGTTADEEGRFTLRVPTARILLIKHIGYEPKELTLGDKRTDLIIRLTGKSKTLTDVVVTGIYKRPVENFTGSAKIITAEELQRISPQNILAAIAVLDPAFQMPENINLGSDPNRLPDVQLRGQNNFPVQSGRSSNASLRSMYGDKPNAPMFVLDGFEVSIQRIFDLDMNRVSRITILKDAAATAIYGSRASNGVIVIDTRQPKEGAVRVSYRGGLQVEAPDLNGYDLLNAKEKLQLEKDAGRYISTRFQGDQLNLDEEYNRRLKAVTSGVNTYWLSQPLQTGVGSTHSLYLEGGDNAVRYGVNLGYQNNVGVMKGSGRQNLSGGVTLNYRSNKLLFGNDLSITSNKATNSPYGSFSAYAKMNPYNKAFDLNAHPLRYLDTSWIGYTYNYLENPIYNATIGSRNNSQYLLFTNNFRFEWSALSWLRFNGSFSFTKSTDESNDFKPAAHTSFDNVDFSQKGSFQKINGKSANYNATLGFDIRKMFGKSLLYVTGGGNLNEIKNESTGVTAVGFPNAKMDNIIFASGYAANTKPTGIQGISRLASLRMNINYSYDNRYLADFSSSIDASSQFGTNKSLAPFWSFGLGWNIHREAFLHNNRLINFLKLRASIGTTGDQRFPPYMAITTYTYANDRYYLNQLSAYLMGYGNPALGWQKGFKRNIGVDATLWQNRWSLSADYYDNSTNDLILDISTPPSLGFSGFKENVGSLRNKGWQVSTNVVLIQRTRQEFFWRIGVSAYHNTNKIDKISNTLKKLNSDNDKFGNDTEKKQQLYPRLRFEEGQSLTALWGVQSMGIDPANGQELFRRRDGTYTYTWDPNDKIVLGDTEPKVSGTISTGVDFKGFSINIYIMYRLGAQIYNQTLVDRVENADITYNVDRRVSEQRWRKPGDHSMYKGITYLTSGGISQPVSTPTYTTSRFVQTENTLDCSSISASYRFPDQWLKRMKMSNTRIDFYLNNPFRISSIKRERGLDYPFANTFSFNINTTFF